MHLSSIKNQQMRLNHNYVIIVINFMPHNEIYFNNLLTNTKLKHTRHPEEDPLLCLIHQKGFIFDT